MTSTSMNTVDAKEQFTDLINRVAHSKDRIILTRRGKDVAAIIPIEDLNLILASQDKHDLHDAIDALKEIRNLGAVSLEQLKDKMDS